MQCLSITLTAGTTPVVLSVVKERTEKPTSFKYKVTIRRPSGSTSSELCEGEGVEMFSTILRVYDDLGIGLEIYEQLFGSCNRTISARLKDELLAKVESKAAPGVPGNSVVTK